MCVLNTKTKTIGVIVTVYNKEKYLNRALDSLLEQSDYPEELIIVDDCSADYSKEIVMQLFPLLKAKISLCTFIDLSVNVGAAEARNVALRKINTDYVVFLDADDRYDSSYICNLRSILLTFEDVSMIASKVHLDSSCVEYPSNRVLKYLSFIPPFFLVQEPFKALAIESLFVGGGNLCFKKDNMPKELFDPNERNFEEWDFYYRILKITQDKKELFVYNPNVSYYYNDVDELSLSRKYITSYKDITIPKLITRLNLSEERPYRALLISIWFYNSVYRLKSYKSKYLFMLSNIKLLRKSARNRYILGVFLKLFIPDVFLMKIVKEYKKYRFTRC